MPGVARENDTVNTGHACTVTTTILSGSTTGNTNGVYANGLGVACNGDLLSPHNDGAQCETPHLTETIKSGSPNVFIGGTSIARIGDDADSAGAILKGSGNVFCN